MPTATASYDDTKQDWKLITNKGVSAFLKNITTGEELDEYYEVVEEGDLIPYAALKAILDKAIIFGKDAYSIWFTIENFSENFTSTDQNLIEKYSPLNESEDLDFSVEFDWDED